MEGPTRSISPDEMSASIGKDFGVSEWFLLDQSRISEFADLTEDHNFIHVNPERAAQTQFGSTIAHGFLTLSMVPVMAYQVAPAVAGTKAGVNYGINRLRFVSAVRAGKRVRGRFTLNSFTLDNGRWQSVWGVTVEIEGEERPALVMDWLNAGFM